MMILYLNVFISYFKDQYEWFGNDNDRINVVRFLYIGESQLMGVLHLPMMLICSKVPVANHLLHSLKVCPLLVLNILK